jgi:Domain of unknown function (DUF4192)
MNPQHPDPHRSDGADPFRRHDAQQPQPTASPADAGLGDSGELVPVVRIGGLADLIATVPYVLTYVPADAVVVMAFAGRRLTVTACLPLPPAAQAFSAARHLNRVLAQASRDLHRPGAGGVTHALVVGYGTPVIDPILTQVAGELAVPVDDVVRVEDDRWWSLTCLDPGCCPPGAPVTAAEHVSLALLVAAGVPAPTRADRARELQPAAAPLQDQIADALTARSAAPTTAFDPSQQYGLLVAAKEVRRDGEVGLVPEEAAGLLWALSDVRVRDACVLWHDRATVRLWLDLVRIAPPGWVAPVATLLALAAYQDGDSVLANLAIDRALDDDPGHRLAGMVRAVLGLGIPPQRLTADLQQIAAQVLPDLAAPSPDAQAAPGLPAVTDESDEIHDRRM